MQIKAELPRKKNTQYYFLIPVSFIRHGLIDPAKKYNISVVEAQNQPQESQILKNVRKNIDNLM